jgi:hypothetical protein
MERVADADQPPGSALPKVEAVLEKHSSLFNRDA